MEEGFGDGTEGEEFQWSSKCCTVILQREPKKLYGHPISVIGGTEKRSNTFNYFSEMCRETKSKYFFP